MRGLKVYVMPAEVSGPAVGTDLGVVAVYRAFIGKLAADYDDDLSKLRGAISRGEPGTVAPDTDEVKLGTKRAGAEIVLIRCLENGDHASPRFKSLMRADALGLQNAKLELSVWRHVPSFVRNDRDMVSFHLFYLATYRKWRAWWAARLKCDTALAGSWRGELKTAVSGARALPAVPFAALTRTLWTASCGEKGRPSIACVPSFTLDHDSLGSARTDVDDRYEIGGIRPGSYCIYAAFVSPVLIQEWCVPVNIPPGHFAHVDLNSSNYLELWQQ